MSATQAELVDLAPEYAEGVPCGGGCKRQAEVTLVVGDCWSFVDYCRRHGKQALREELELLSYYDPETGQEIAG